MKKCRIGLLGCGNVGKNLYHMINRGRERFIREYCLELSINKIAVRDKTKHADIPGELLTEDPFKVVTDENSDVIVELLGGVEPAYELINLAFALNKPVIIANKEIISTYYREIFSKARVVKFEGAVGGGIPIIRTITRSYTGNVINNIFGILNGTTNFILTKMDKEGITYEDALKEAQKRGFAEADPRLDVEGTDPFHKIRILSNIAYKTYLDNHGWYTEGITKIKPMDVEIAKELGYVIKLIARSSVNEGQIDLQVRPMLVQHGHPVGKTDNEENSICLESPEIGQIMLSGKGAGGKPTASVVLSDIIDLAVCGSDTGTYQIINSYSPLNFLDVENAFYIRFGVENTPGVIGKIGTILGDYEINIIEVKAFLQKQGKLYGNVAIITDRIKENNIREAIKELNDYSLITERILYPILCI